MSRKSDKNVIVISPIKLRRFWWNLVYRFPNKFAANIVKCKRFHFISIMSLHYLVKLEMLITHVLPLSSYRNKLQNSSHLNCILQIRQICVQLITACGKYCKRRCTKHESLICSYQLRHWQMAATITTWWSLAHSVLSRCFSSFRSLIRILYTFCCNSPHML